MMNDAPLMLSVSGLRGVVGQSLTPTVAGRYAAAFGSWLIECAGRGGPSSARPPHIVLGRDSRPSGRMYELAAAAALASVGCRVTMLGIVSTPAVGVMVRHIGADGGLIITASHNPIIWNGIKSITPEGAAPRADQANAIIERFHRDQPRYVDVTGLQTLDQDDSAPTVHVAKVLDHIDTRAIAERRLKVVLDSVHGAGGPEGRMLLEALGVEVVHLYGEPTGKFPHTPEPTRDNLIELCDAVKKHGADLGFAQDPDADRLAIVDEHGAYIGEEYTLALATMHVLGSAGKGATVAANLSTSRMVDDLAARHDAQVIRTPVGEANVASAMRDANSIIGGEGNGGVIWPVIGMIRDSLAGMALVLELMAKRGQSLSTIVNDIPGYAMVKDKAPVRAVGGADGDSSSGSSGAARAIEALRERYADEQLDEQDGLRIDFPGNKWLHVRASNTEPIVRMIAEAQDEATARELVGQAREVLEQGLGVG